MVPSGGSITFMGYLFNTDKFRLPSRFVRRFFYSVFNGERNEPSPSLPITLFLLKRIRSSLRIRSIIFLGMK